ncbi:MAG: UDP-N-acetylglucosamine 2-epimerase [Cyclobacteriaceae bacterium]
MKIGVLTSARADFGIYTPLLNSLKEDEFFDLEIIAFGTHLSKFHGYTVDYIEDQGFAVYHKITSLLVNDNPNSIATSYALTSLKFADFWEECFDTYEYVFCLGDRFEMAAAVNAGIPYGIRFAHIHGGDTTLGAIDNIYRHQISLASKLHFVAIPNHADRVKELVGNEGIVEVVGSLSLENISGFKLLSKQEFWEVWKIDLSMPTILVTVHPETVGYEQNEFFAQETYAAIFDLVNDYQVIITLPNADTSGTLYRECFEKLGNELGKKIHLVENFGTRSYFTCMKYCNLLFGNSSSGIIEAASFEKYVINIGDRQMGRAHGKNVVNVPFERNELVNAVKLYATRKFDGKNLYDQGGAVKKIILTLKTHQ